MLSCSIMKNRAILDQIARITYIANNDRVPRFAAWCRTSAARHRRKKAQMIA
jgi:hypothetical protein